jgi:hypothetical protein
MRRRRRSRATDESALGVEEKPGFDEAHLHADSLPRKDPSEMVGSPVILPVELPTREEVASELAGRWREEFIACVALEIRRCLLRAPTE